MAHWPLSWVKRQRHHRSLSSQSWLRARLRNPPCDTFLTEKELMIHLETLSFRGIKRILRTSQSEHGCTTGVLLISRGQSLCQKSLHRNSTNMGRVRELVADLRHNNTQIEWTKGHTEHDSLEADLNREADACCTEAYEDEFPLAWPSERRLQAISHSCGCHW